MLSRVVPGYLGHYVAVFAYEGVDDARLTHVRSPYDGKAWNVFEHLFVGHVFKLFHDEVEQVARSSACCRADAHGVSQPQLIRFGCLVGVSAVVYLIGYQDDGHV